MPAHGLKLSRDSGRSDQAEADGLLLESPNTYLNFYRYFRSVALGRYCYLKFVFCPIHSQATVYYFLMFSLVSFLILWIPCVSPHI